MSIAGGSHNSNNDTPFIGRTRNQRQSTMLQNRIKALTTENETLKNQLRDVLRERDRQLREVAATEAQKYEHKLDQVRRRASEQRSREIQIIRQSMSNDWGRRVDIIAQSKDKEVARVQSRLSMHATTSESLARARKEIVSLKEKLDITEQRIKDYEWELDMVKDKYTTCQKELEEKPKEHANELRAMKAAFEEEKNQLEATIQSKELEIISLKEASCKCDDEITAVSPKSLFTKKSPVASPEHIRTCSECQDLRIALKLAESEKQEAFLKAKRMESTLMKVGHGMDTNSLVMALMSRVQQMEAERDRLQMVLKEAKDQNELLEFQLLEIQEEAASASEATNQHSMDTWRHPFTIMSPIPPSQQDEICNGISDDEGFMSRDESCYSSDSSAIESSPIQAHPIRKASLQSYRMPDDLRIKFSLLRHRRTLRNEDRDVIAEIKKRWDALEYEHSKCQKNWATIEEEVTKGPTTSEGTQTNENGDHEFELRQELSKLKYMMKASDITEKRQKQCIGSLKKQLESLRQSREAEMDILKQTVAQYAKELENFRNPFNLTSPSTVSHLAELTRPNLLTVSPTTTETATKLEFDRSKSPSVAIKGDAVLFDGSMQRK